MSLSSMFLLLTSTRVVYLDVPGAICKLNSLNKEGFVSVIVNYHVGNMRHGIYDIGNPSFSVI